jgi:hypothetical protein
MVGNQPGQNLPAKRLRPGDRARSGSVNDDVVASDGHAGSVRHAGPYPGNRAVLQRTGRSPQVTPRNSAQIV